jgi:hypothetical protein
MTEIGLKHTHLRNDCRDIRQANSSAPGFSQETILLLLAKRSNLIGPLNG